MMKTLSKSSPLQIIKINAHRCTFLNIIIVEITRQPISTILTNASQSTTEGKITTTICIQVEKATCIITITCTMRNSMHSFNI